MRPSIRLTALAALFACQNGAAPATVRQSVTGKTDAVIARSKRAQVTYAIYYWNRIEHPGQRPIEEWSAEFNSANHHRVETPRDRVIADCAAHTGTYLSLATGQVVTGPQIAGVACGINTNLPFLKTEFLGRVKSRFGDADRVRVTDAQNVRTYDISDSGVILRTVFETNDSRHLTVVDVETVAIFDKLPDTAMFDAASLKRSFVPDQFKKTPK